MAWVLAHLQRRGRETDSSKVVFNSETKSSMGQSDCGKVIWSSFTVRTTSRWALAKSSSKTALRKGLPRSPSKPLRAASPPRAQQARIARLSSPPHAEASPTNHEIKQRRKRSAGKYLDYRATGCPHL